ncbi:MAG: helix-turn-helix domain-containing protein [Fibromonadaceae bacterium]|jgi:hypothetical protein|nr:helix-turn-helix domain-containing protein [Fibromonadaceae bacterium]
MEKQNHRDVKIVGGQEYWTSGKAAEYLGIAKVTLLNYAKRDTITKLCIGSYVFFKPEWLDEFINERTTIGIANRKGGKQ